MRFVSSQPGVIISGDAGRVTRRLVPLAIPIFVGRALTDEVPAVTRVESFAAFTRRYPCGDPSATAADAEHALFTRAIEHFFDNGGQPCYVTMLSSADAWRDAVTPAFAQQIGVDAPDAALLCVPGLAEAPAPVWAACWATLLEAAARQRQLFLLLDPSSVPALASEQLAALTSLAANDTLTCGAAYWPHLVTPGDAGVFAGARARQAPTVPPSAAVAATIQRTDREHGPWKAPANLPLARTVKPQHDHRGYLMLTAPDRADGVLANRVRSLAGRGTRVWGCRTLQPGPLTARSFVQTSRTLTFIERSLTEVCRFAVFETNHPITWARVKGLAYAWLHELWLAGGLVGETREQAFDLWLGDGESMTAEDIEAGRMILKVALALHYPLEFIVLRLTFANGSAAAPGVSRSLPTAVMP